MDAVRDQFTEAARRAAARCGFDLLELHCAHGYLLSGFLSPLTNLRTDAYGGDLEGRLRFPLEVFDAVRAVWPRAAHDGPDLRDRLGGGRHDRRGRGGDRRAFAAHGADAIDVSTGQVVPDERPEYGRSYQTPFADRIRNTLGVPVIAVGAISSWDDVNSLCWPGARTCARWPGPICTTRTGRCTPPRSRATQVLARPGRCPTGRAAAPRPPVVPTRRSPASRCGDGEAGSSGAGPFRGRGGAGAAGARGQRVRRGERSRR